MNGVPAEIIVGHVMHERLRPCRHVFNYPIFCLRIDLARLSELNSRWFGVDKARPMGLRSKDYGPRDGSCLLTWIRGLLQEAGLPSDGAVYLQTFPRFLGYGFNPVNFWYCHDAQGALRSVLAEVNNTFGEHHLYLLQAEGGEPITGRSKLRSTKVFHVSPFCAIEGHYQFMFRDGAKSRFAGINYHDSDGLLMRTSISGTSLPFTPSNLRRCFFRQPVLTLAVMARIHWQALRLWLRKVPFHRKPEPPSAGLSHERPSTSPAHHQEPL